MKGLSLIKHCYPLPGISDHEIVYIKSCMKAAISVHFIKGQ